MKKIVLLVDEVREQGALDICSFYTFDCGLTYTYWMDDEWRIHTAIYSCREDVQVNDPIWHYIMDPRNYSKYGEYTPDFIMELMQGPCDFSGYDIPSKIMRETLLHYNSSDEKFIRTSEIECKLKNQLYYKIREAIKEYEEILAKESKSNK